MQLSLEHPGNGGLEIKDGRCAGMDRDDQVVDVEVHLIVNIAGHGDPDQIPYRDFEPGKASYHGPVGNLHREDSVWGSSPGVVGRPIG